MELRIVIAIVLVLSIIQVAQSSCHPTCLQFGPHCAEKTKICTKAENVEVRDCIKKKQEKKCMRWEHKTEKVCKQRKEGSCQEWTPQPKKECVRYTQKCVRYEMNPVKNCKKATEFCKGWGTRKEYYCTKTASKCVKYKYKKTKWCSKQYALCKSYKLARNKFCRAKCIRKKSVLVNQCTKKCIEPTYKYKCLKYKLQKNKFCKKYEKGKCLAWKMKKVCLQKDCPKDKASSCKCLVWKLRPVRKTRNVCLKYRKVKICTFRKSKQGKCLLWKKVRKCVKRKKKTSKICIKRAPVDVNKRKCIRWKHYTSKKCIKDVLERHCKKIEKNCKFVEQDKWYTANVCKSRLSRKREKSCSKWLFKQKKYCERFNKKCDVACAKTKSVCVGFGVKSHKYCKKGHGYTCEQVAYEQKNGKCLQTERTCAEYKTIDHKVCTKWPDDSCLFWDDVRKRVCAEWKNEEVCLEYKTRWESKCVQHAEECKRYENKCLKYRQCDLSIDSYVLPNNFFNRPSFLLQLMTRSIQTAREYGLAKKK